MGTPDNDMHQLTGAYVADALDDVERRAFERHLADCDSCAREVRELQETGARLSMAASERPPGDLWDRVRAATATTPQLPPTPAHELRGGGRRWATPFLTAAACVLLLVAIGLGVWNAQLHGRLDETQRLQSRTAAVLAAPDATVHSKPVVKSGSASVVVSRSRNAAVFVGNDLPALRGEHTYELWVITASGPHPAGLVRPANEGHALRLLESRVADAQQVAMTVEPEGGSPQPTTKPVFAVKVAG